MRADLSATAVLVMRPTDHIIRDGGAFGAAIDRAVTIAHDGALVILGVPPSFASTKYGYVRRAPGPTYEPDGYAVEAFIEKPPARVRRRSAILLEQRYLVFTADTYLVELRRLRPGIAALCEAAVARAHPDHFFPRCRGVCGLSVRIH